MTSPCRLFVLVLILVSPVASSRPPQPPPGTGDIETRAKLIADAIRKNQPALADAFFYPADQFPRVKAIKDPGKYFDYLRRVFHKDIETMRERLAEPDKVTFVSFDLGRGRNWIPPRKEANKAPYYATYKSRLVLKDQGKDRTFFVRVMISWEGQWYCTHLLRKSLNEKVPGG